MPKVTIAAINSACAGARLSWAAACDLRYAPERAVFTTAFANAGLSGDFGGTWTLSRIVGPGKARELYLLGDRIDAAEAHRIGFLSRVLPADETWSACALRMRARLPVRSWRRYDRRSAARETGYQGVI